MSRTWKHAPYMVRAARLNRRTPTPALLKLWDTTPSYRFFGCPEWDTWWNDRPSVPGHLQGVRYGESTKDDRRLEHRRLRAIERDRIAHEEYDLIPPHVRGWLD